jgi:hypothetical protein
VYITSINNVEQIQVTMVNVSSILTVTTTNFLKLLTMQYILTCPNGKKIDMTSDVLKQMKGEITRENVTNKIQFLKDNNIK